MPSRPVNDSANESWTGSSLYAELIVENTPRRVCGIFSVVKKVVRQKQAGLIVVCGGITVSG